MSGVSEAETRVVEEEEGEEGETLGGRDDGARSASDIRSTAETALETAFDAAVAVVVILRAAVAVPVLCRRTAMVFCWTFFLLVCFFAS